MATHEPIRRANPSQQRPEPRGDRANIVSLRRYRIHVWVDRRRCQHRIRNGVRAERVRLAGYADVPCVNSSYEFASEVAGELAADAECGWAFVWWRNSDGTYTTSLRSRDGGPHVGEIATQFGGGGHPGAAGFRSIDPVWAF